MLNGSLNSRFMITFHTALYAAGTINSSGKFGSIHFFMREVPMSFAMRRPYEVLFEIGEEEELYKTKFLLTRPIQRN